MKNCRSPLMTPRAMTLRPIILFALALLLAAPLFAHAQQLQPAQVAALKTACAAEPGCTALAAAADDVALAEWFNAAAEPAYIVWRPSVTQRELMEDPAFDWARVDNLSVGKARIWDWMFQLGPINPGNANVRAGIDATWVGTAADLAVRAAILAKCKRSATRAERALASGTGTTATPAVLTWTGPISFADASLIRS